MCVCVCVCVWVSNCSLMNLYIKKMHNSSYYQQTVSYNSLSFSLGLFAAWMWSFLVVISIPRGKILFSLSPLLRGSKTTGSAAELHLWSCWRLSGSQTFQLEVKDLNSDLLVDGTSLISQEQTFKQSSASSLPQSRLFSTCMSVYCCWEHLTVDIEMQ